MMYLHTFSTVDGFAFSFSDFAWSTLISFQKKENRFAGAIIISFRQMSHKVSIVFYTDCVLIGKILWFHSTIQGFSFNWVSNFWYSKCWYSFKATIANSSLVSIFSDMVTENSTVIVICLATLLLLLIRKSS